MKKETVSCLVFLACALLIGVASTGKKTLSLFFAKKQTEQSKEEALEFRPRDRASPDPRLAYAGPFQNLHPAVRYIGSEKCGKCHPKIAENYARHPMARTLASMSSLTDSLPYDRMHDNPFQALGSEFRVERQHARVRHRQIRQDDTGKVVFDVDMDVAYVLGSGSHGHSFINNRDGYLFQTPISWFSQQKKWGLSPGFGGELLAGRPVPGKCFFCHANHSLPREGFENRYEPPVFEGLGIGCERCHGPGELHYRNPGHFTLIPESETEGSPFLAAGVRSLDRTIVNPKKLNPKLREAVCQQCHLTGERRVLPRGRKLYDFRPGLPLDACWSVFVYSQSNGAGQRAVNHVEQMHLSRCFLRSKSNNKLGCISCHDPHRNIGLGERTDFYRRRCLTCHTSDKSNRPEAISCSLPTKLRLEQSKDDSCIHCHMPRYDASDIVHNASTNHRILRHSLKSEQNPTNAPQGADPLLVLFEHGPVSRDDRGRSRDLGIALVDMASARGGTSTQFKQALSVLTENLERDDLDAWNRKGQALLHLGRHSEALAAFETILEKAPNRELACIGAAMLCPDPNRSLAHWRHAVVINPWMSQYRSNLARTLAQQRLWREAGLQCLACLRLNPADVHVRKLWIECLLHENRRTEARAEFDKIVALKPVDLDQINDWFAKQLK
jgi:tetratricopeptide (TPR) repeat protein